MEGGREGREGGGREEGGRSCGRRGGGREGGILNSFATEINFS